MEDFLELIDSLSIEGFETNCDGLDLIYGACCNDYRALETLMKELRIYEELDRFRSRHKVDDPPMPENWQQFFKLLRNSPHREVLIRIYRVRKGLVE